MSTTIAEATLDELHAEIARRCPVGLLMLAVPDDRDSCETRHYAWGHPYTVLGFAATANVIAQASCVSRRRPSPPDQPGEPEDDE